MVIYLPVKFEFDWTNRFRVRVRKRKCGRTVGLTDGRQTYQSNSGLVTRNLPNNIIIFEQLAMAAILSSKMRPNFFSRDMLL